jgi:hypothetical protein
VPVDEILVIISERRVMSSFAKAFVRLRASGFRRRQAYGGQVDLFRNRR